jgi:hypothetical protein
LPKATYGIVWLLLLQLLASRADAGDCHFSWQHGQEDQGVSPFQVDTSLDWDPDGSGPQDEVLVFGGHFFQAGGASARRVAAWNGTNWQRFGTGMDNRVLALAENQGELIAGGIFWNSGNLPYIARWNDGMAQSGSH